MLAAVDAGLLLFDLEELAVEVGYIVEAGFEANG